MHTTLLPRLPLCFSFSHSYVHAVYTCTYDTYIRVRRGPFSPPVGSHQLKILSFTIHPRALFSLYGDVVRNTYVTPKLIRYNFTGRLRSSIYSHLLRRRAVGLPVGLSVLPLPRLPTSQRRYPLPVIGFPRFSQLFLKSHATLFFLGSCSSLSLSLLRPRRALARVASRNNRPANERQPPPLILSPQTLRSRYFVARDRSRDLRSSIALLS